MARKPEGWSVAKDPRNGTYFVRFRHAGRQYKRSTATRDPKEAKRVAGQIYEKIISEASSEAKRYKTLKLLVGEWLLSIEGVVSEGTLKSDEDRWKRLLLPHFRTAENITSRSIQEYTTQRLRKVARATVVKELVTLRRFLKWAYTAQQISNLIDVPTPSKNARGTRCLDREATAISDEQGEAVLAKLPELTTRGHRAKAFFTFLWETGLRIGTVERIEAGRHWRPGWDYLKVTADIDTVGLARELPLTEKATEALESIWKPKGLLFPKYYYTKTLRTAAKKAGLPEHIYSTLNARDFRHSRCTNLGDHSKNVNGIAYLAGHKDLRTTSRYIHPGKKAARDALDAAKLQPIRVANRVADDVVGNVVELTKLLFAGNALRTRQDSNLRLLPPEAAGLSDSNIENLMISITKDTPIEVLEGLERTLLGRVLGRNEELIRGLIATDPSNDKQCPHGDEDY